VLTPPYEAAQAVFDTGNVVSDLACELFPDGKEVPFTRDYDEMIATTKQWLDDDVLHVSDVGVNIYEIKSSTEVKDIYLHDVLYTVLCIKELRFQHKKCKCSAY
jgi:hypothetical protein